MKRSLIAALLAFALPAFAGSAHAAVPASVLKSLQPQGAERTRLVSDLTGRGKQSDAFSKLVDRGSKPRVSVRFAVSTRDGTRSALVSVLKGRKTFASGKFILTETIDGFTPIVAKPIAELVPKR